MNIKNILLSAFTLFMVQNVSAQDKIYKSNGDVIEVKVKSVNENDITYKKSNNPDGPDYHINKTELTKVIYANGSEENYNGTGERSINFGRGRTMQHKRKPKIHYGNNVLAFVPVQLSNEGIGIGITYERVLDKDGMFSFYLPLSYSYNDLGGMSAFDPVGVYSDGRSAQSISMFYACPGIKYYPTSSFGKVKYSVGASLVVASGTTYKSDYVTDPVSGYPVYQDRISQDRFLLGFMITNSLNINPSSKLYLGIDMNLGTSYLNQIDGKTDDVRFLAQFAIKAGFRF
jgi:hypothetical protein